MTFLANCEYDRMAKDCPDPLERKHIAVIITIPKPKEDVDLQPLVEAKIKTLGIPYFKLTNFFVQIIES